MTAFASILSLLVSIAGVAYLASTDPKRLRAFGRDVPRNRRFQWHATAAVFLPSLVLIGTGQIAAFVIWVGAITVMGWAVAAMTPAQIDTITGGISHLKEQATSSKVNTKSLIVSGLGGFFMNRDEVDHSRIEALEKRIAVLENARSSVSILNKGELENKETLDFVLQEEENLPNRNIQ